MGGEDGQRFRMQGVPEPSKLMRNAWPSRGSQEPSQTRLVSSPPLPLPRIDKGSYGAEPVIIHTSNRTIIPSSLKTFNCLSVFCLHSYSRSLYGHQPLRSRVAAPI